MKRSEQKIRERILSDVYGKFDLVECILTKEELLNWKPRIVLENISVRLSIPLDKINRKTFWSWLRRYRLSKNDSVLKSIKSLQPLENFSGNGTKIEEEGLRNYKRRISNIAEERPVLIKVIRSQQKAPK